MNAQYVPALFGLLGVLIGFGGNFLLQMRIQVKQREQWILDNKKTEWKELIGALSHSARSVMQTAPFGELRAAPAEDARLCDAANDGARKTIQDRIFIADRMKTGNVLERWQGMMEKDDIRLFWGEWNDLHESLLKAAHGDLGIKT